MTTQTTDRQIKPLHTNLLMAILLAAGLIVYSNSFHSGMVFDDHPFIISDPAVHMTAFSWNSVKTAAIKGLPAHRYLPNISFALNYYFGQLNTFGYHLVNLVIHLMSGVCLFFFLRLTLRLYHKHSDEGNPDLIAFFAALLWIVQPVGTQAVTYICQRMASMVALFYILSLLLYVKGRLTMHQNPGKFLVSGLYFSGCAIIALCALATKENAGTLPITILLYEWFFFQDLRLRWSRTQILWSLFFILIFSGAVIWYMGENPIIQLLDSYRGRNFTMLERILTEFRIVVYYISLFLWAPPGRLNLDHDYPLSVSLASPPTTFISLMAIVSLLAFAAYTAKKDRLISFCILWFFITQATESTIIGIELIFEHRTYIPFMLTSLLVVLLAFRLIQNRPVAYGLMIAIAMLFSIWTYQRNQTWRTLSNFWTDSVQKSPAKFRPNLNLGFALFDAGNIDGAISQYKKALKFKPGDVDTMNHLANALFQKGFIEAAINYYLQSLKINPNQTEVHLDLGKIRAQQKAFDQAINHFNRALELDPKSAFAYNNLGNVLAEKGLLDEAIDVFHKALELDPNYADVHNNMGNAYVRKGLLDEALYHYEMTITEGQTNKNTVKNRDALLSLMPPPQQANLLFKTAARFAGEKQYERSVDLFQRVLAIYPDNPLIYYNISCLYSLRNQKPQAVNWLKQAVDHGYNNWEKMKIDPDFNNIKNEPYFRHLLAP